eukprot:9301007-Alexandrium_andersonii.AAC.1
MLPLWGRLMAVVAQVPRRRTLRSSSWSARTGSSSSGAPRSTRTPGLEGSWVGWRPALDTQLGRPLRA